jgi:hypothetical protein
VFEQDVVAHGIHEGAKTFGLADFSAAQRDEDSGEGFLPDVLNSLRRIQARAQLELNQLAEVRHEMFLRSKISRTETVDVGFVKRLEFQSRALAGAGVAVV